MIDNYEFKARRLQGPHFAERLQNGNRRRQQILRTIKIPVLTLVVTVCLVGFVRADCPVGDLSGDCIVNLEDLKLFAEQWLDPPGCVGHPNDCADLDGANGVDMFDFALLAANWHVIGVMTGSLQVTISPPEAVTAGAQWRVDGGTWRDSNDIETGLSLGSHMVEYSTISGWNTPANEPVQINYGQTTTTTGTYIQQTGSLQVTILPPEAVTAGAQWRVDGGTWRDSNDIETGLSLGSHMVEYSTISGWNTPANEPVQINYGQTTTTTGTYIQQTGSLQVTILPPEAVTAGAQWRVDGGTWRDSNDIETGLSVGSHTVEYRAISGWNTPANEPVQINYNQTTTTSGTYIEQISAPLVINEFMAFNGTIFGTLYISGGDDRHPDWIEIHNLDLQDTINLEGWYLTDDDGRLTEWRFPAGVTIGPNGYLIVYASGWGPGFVDPLGYHHTNFELSSDGEYLALVAPDGQTIVHEYQSYQGGFPPQSLDHSYGIKDNDINQESYFGTPTPEAQNTDAKLGLVADTKFSSDRGFYDEQFSVAITTETEGATIRYTLDSTEPTMSNGLTYNDSIDVNTTTSLRAFAFKTDWLPTNVDTQTYIFLAEVANQPEFPPGLPTTWAGYTADYGVDPDVVNTTLPGYSFEEALLWIPSICITMPSDDLFGAADGIYVYSTSKGDAWERPASIELIYPDGRDGFQVNAGTHIHGGASRNHSRTLKHSFRLVFRGIYGPSKLNFPLYSDSDVELFNQLVLRGSSGDSWSYPDSYRDGIVRHIKEQAQYTRDPWMKDSQRAMGHHSAHSIFVHLYLNGLYWGQYNLCERPNSSFQASYYGGDKEEYDAIHDRDELQSGTMEVWDEMFDLAAAGLASDQDAQFIQGNNPDGTRNPAFPIILNVDNLIDYMILHIYARVEDWPCHNFWVARRRGPLSEGFRFFVWDQENHTNTLERLINGCGSHIEILPEEVSPDLRPGYLYGKLRENLMFRREYIDRVHKHMFNGGLLTPEKVEERWMKRATEIDKSVVGESARWGDAQRSVPYKREVEWLTEQNWIRTVYWPQIGSIVLERYHGVGLYPDIQAPVFQINDVNQHGGHISTTDQLTMVNPNASGTTYYTLDGNDPRLPTALQTSVILVAEDDPKRVLIPTGPVNDDWKGGQPFNDNQWNDGTPITPGKTGGVGYEASSGYEDYITYDVYTEMYNQNDTCYIRIPFTFNGDPCSLTFMTLKIRYDDGFIAYLNGVKIAEALAPASPQWDSSATNNHSDSFAKNFEDIPVSDYISDLEQGDNILAIHGLNCATNPSDFLISVELLAGALDHGAPSPTAAEYNTPLTFTESTIVKASILDVNGWSALNEATFAVGPVADNLRITEIMYHPQDMGHPNDPNAEFIELKNIGTQTINLSLVRFTRGIDFTFPSLQLAAGGYVLVVKDHDAFAAQDPNVPAAVPIIGPYTGKLDNDGERIRLADATDQTIHEFRYRDGWYDITDGLGFSLTIKDPNNTDPNAWGEKSSWRPSAAIGGSPGRDDAGDVPELGSVKINELLAHSHALAPDWIELHNTTDELINIGGWFLSDDDSNFMKYEIDPNAVIDSNGYIVFYQDQHFDNPNDLGCNVRFALSENGETLYLHSGRDGELTGYSEEEKFGASETGVAFGRYRKSTGTYNFVAMSENTPWLPNAYPKVGPIVINEIMYHPNDPSGDAEYVELLNISGSSVTLYDSTTNEPWKFVDDESDPGIELFFPVSSPLTLADGEYLLLVKDLQVFNSKFTAASGVTILEWGGGKLKNGREKPQISMPGDVNAQGVRQYIRIDRVHYSDGSHHEDFDYLVPPLDPWPTGPDGYGQSLTRIDPNLYGNDVINWRADEPSPGSANP